MDCEKCGKTLKNASSLQRHLYRCMVDEKATCPTCNKTFSSKYSLANHKSRFHAESVSMEAEIVKSENVKTENMEAVKTEDVKTEDKAVQASLRDECKERVFDFMWRGVTCHSIPYGILDVYQIKKRFFENLHSFFQFKLEEILNDREQLLVSAMLNSDSLEECRYILNGSLDIFVTILSKAHNWAEN